MRFCMGTERWLRGFGIDWQHNVDRRSPRTAADVDCATKVSDASGHAGQSNTCRKRRKIQGTRASIYAHTAPIIANDQMQAIGRGSELDTHPGS